MVTREANSADWDKLYLFFFRIYRENHPLLNKEFWEWQYGNKLYGRSFICLNDNHEIVGHVGANFGGGLAWIINVYLDEGYRGKGILGRLYELVRNYYPLAATAANEAGLGLYRNMRWIRYYDLVRYVKINHNVINPTTETICIPIEVNTEKLIIKDSHYFQQPSLDGLLLNSGSKAVCNKRVGGIRMVDIEDLTKTENEIWELGYLWIDYITSWNDLKTLELEKNNWVLDYKSVIPWRLNPLQKDYFCDITFLSEKPLDNNFIVHRSYSDHGRIGSM